MRLLSSLLLTSALSLSAGTALAACPDGTAGTDVKATAGIAGNVGDNLIAKDGTRAPLEGAAQPGTAGQAADGNQIAKDGRTMPLADEYGGGDRFLATSEQDVEAQQRGEETAAAAALDGDAAPPAERDMNTTASVGKDGTRAPLESAARRGGGNLIAKDGSTMPLADAYGGGDRFLATSQQDVEAQQHGEETAAAAALDGDAAPPPEPDMTRTAGIAKDGTHAPLEEAQPGAAGQSGGGNLVAKDGSTMPLADEPGGGDRFPATSGQDVEAQQRGRKTAAATAVDDCD